MRLRRSSISPYTTLFRSKGECVMDLSSMEIRNIRDPWKEGLAKGWQVVDASTLSDDQVFEADVAIVGTGAGGDRKSTRLNSSHVKRSYAVFCLKKKDQVP